MVKPMFQTIDFNQLNLAIQNLSKEEAAELLGIIDSYPPPDFESYQTRLIDYAKEFHNINFWPSVHPDYDGQLEFFTDIQESVRQQLEGKEGAFRTFRVDSAHGMGKTYGAALIVDWFHNCFHPSITYTTAPSKDQVEKLLWKEIRALRENKPWLPGTLQPSAPELKGLSPDHFALGRTVSSAGGKTSERFQGQHGKYLLFIVDEAEGVTKEIFDAIKAMMTGGTVVLAIFLANPKTRSSQFHKLGKNSNVKNYRFDAIYSPNVFYGKEVVPNLTNRLYVEEMLEENCQVVSEHDESQYTFELPWRIGTIYLPDGEFLFRVRGIAPANLSGSTFLASGVYEAAVQRGKSASPVQSTTARIGVDVARDGTDYGTVYLEHGLVVERKARISQLDSWAYYDRIKKTALALPSYVTSLHIRVDGTGGFGSGVIDTVKKDMELRSRFPDFKVVEVKFGAGTVGTYKTPAYANYITEITATACARVGQLAIKNPPNELEADLCERPYEWVIDSAKNFVKRLEGKDQFRTDHESRSPDDGDGFVLCVAPDHIMQGKIVTSQNY